MSHLYHGGIRGLDVGDLLIPSPPHQTDGCPICVARSQGRVVTVGEYRQWLSRFGERARPAIDALDGAEDWMPVDPPSARNAVYVTSDPDYAMWYAARSEGDLYRVAPIGGLQHSPEDPFPSWTCERARVVSVVRRKVRLRPRERRRLSVRWQEMDAKRGTA